MIFLVIGLIISGIMAWAIWRATQARDPMWEGVVIAFSAMCMIGITIGPICVCFSNIGTAAKLTAFYEVNNQNYKATVQATENLLTVNPDKYTSSLVEGSLERLGQAQSVSQRIAEWRTAVNQYNADVLRIKAYHNNPLLLWIYPSLSELQLIEIENKEG